MKNPVKSGIYNVYHSDIQNNLQNSLVVVFKEKNKACFAYSDDCFDLDVVCSTVQYDWEYKCSLDDYLKEKYKRYCK